MSTATLPNQIRATIHQDALARVPDFFNATSGDILNELLQNSRRSGATRVDITLYENQCTICDDGRGIKDPQALLAFGLSDWNPELTQNEHPAGMGLYSLARLDSVTIRSNTGNHPAWQVTLTPGNFTGESPAPVLPLDQTMPRGTRISFKHRNTMKSAIENAARYFPIPVTLNGQPLPRLDFLRDAVYTTDWEGTTIGVYTRNQNLLNFHGVVINNPGLPMVHSVQHQWGVAVDVHNCPQLQLTLPARREMVVTPFTEELRDACYRAIYHAIQLNPDPIDVPKQVQDSAAEHGFTLPDARPLLNPWTPKAACDDRPMYGHRPEKAPVQPDSIVMDLPDCPADQQALARATDLPAIRDRLFDCDPHMQGYGWYDGLTRITSLDINVTSDGETVNLQQLRKNAQTAKNHRPDEIRFTMHGQNQDGAPAEFNLETDLAFEDGESDWTNDIRPLVTKSSSLQAGQLADIMEEAFFNPSDEVEADSFDTQLEYHRDECQHIARQLLESPEDAARSAIEDAVDRYIAFSVPKGWTAVITITPKNAHSAKSVTVTFQKATPDNNPEDGPDNNPED